jgi:hypothetical protein
MMQQEVAFLAYSVKNVFHIFWYLLDIHELTNCSDNTQIISLDVGLAYCQTHNGTENIHT